MKKTTIRLLSIVALLSVLMFGCKSIKKMVDNANQIQRTTVPSPLEMHAEQVPVQINFSFPPKFFHKKAYLVITPVLKTDDGSSEIKLESKTIQGEKVKDNNPVIKYETGGSWTYYDTIPYQDAFRTSDLELQINVSDGKGKSFPSIATKLTDGVITTPRLVEDGMLVDNGSVGNTNKGMARTMITTVTLPASSEELQNVTVFYPLQQSALQPKEKKKVEVTDFIKKLTDNAKNTEKQLQGLTIASYASPDGPEKLNEGLVNGRGKTADGFLKEEFKKAKLDPKFNNVIARETTPNEDWEGFKTVTSSSDVKDKELILRVLQMYQDPIVREREIKNISSAYNELRTKVLPQLRRSEVKVSYITKQKTKEEIISLGTTSPDKLKQVELFYAGQEAEASQKEAIYTAYTQRYTDDWKGYNNLGVVQIGQNKLNEAETNLKKAESIEANNAMVLNNLGVVYWAKGDYKKAEEYFNRAKATNNSDAIGYNLGVIQIKQAKYKDAVISFGNTNSFNKGLAQILAGKSSDATNTLKGVNSEHAKLSYLKAIAAARNGNEDECYNNLRTAVAKDASLKEYAKADLEFLKYFQNETFKAIVGN